MIRLIIILTTILPGLLLGQNRLYTHSEDTLFEGHLYRIARIGRVVELENGAQDIHWKLWFIDDLKPYQRDYVLDMKTQRNQTGVGLFLNANYDSIYFNPEGAMRSCPHGWRIPRIGEWDTLFMTIDRAQKREMFHDLPGYVSYTIEKKDSITINKIVERLKGGFWWSSTQESEGNRYWGIELDSDRNKNNGKGSECDRAAARCVRDDE